MYRVQMTPMNSNAQNDSVFAAQLNYKVALVRRSKFCAEAILQLCDILWTATETHRSVCNFT
jgi:hypothetical protein